MPIQPVYLDIPADIQRALDLNQLVRVGGVVRDPAGKFVVLLKEVTVLGKEPAAASQRLSLLKGRSGLTVILIGTAAAGSVIGALAVKKRVQAHKCAKKLNASLVAYLEGVREGSLDEATISRLIADLDAAEEYAPNGQVGVASQLANLVVDYTAKLAAANSVDLNEFDAEAPECDGSTVVDLRRHLNAQRRIFIDAA